MSAPQAKRDANMAFLLVNKFKPADWLPVPPEVGAVSDDPAMAGGTLRPELEIANRFLCHCAVFAWGSAPKEFESKIAELISNNNLREHMTENDLEIVDKEKDAAFEEHAGNVGWRLENMWALAWIMGAIEEEPSAVTGQIKQEISGPLMGLFLPDFSVTAELLLADHQTQPLDDIIRMEDRFYLAHNAVRTGQMGHPDALPEGFDPIADGGAIHERRHSLTWALSPGVEWDKTDMST